MHSNPKQKPYKHEHLKYEHSDKSYVLPTFIDFSFKAFEYIQLPKVRPLNSIV